MAITLSQTASVYRSTGATTQTLSFTTVTDDTELLVLIRALDADAVTGVTFNGNSLTLTGTRQKQGTNSDYLYFYRLSNPSVATANITISLSSARRVIVSAISLQGTNASTAEDSDGTNSSGTSASLTMTSTTSGAWHIVGVVEDSAVYSSLTNITIAETENTVAFMYIGYYEASAAGNVTQTYNWSGASQYAMMGVVIAPSVTANNDGNFFAFF